MDFKKGSSLSFKLRTVVDKALLMYTASGIIGKNFILLEIYDGKLWLVYNYGQDTHRVELTNAKVPVVNDGRVHEVKIRFFNKNFLVVLDNEKQRINLEAGERLPSNLGKDFSLVFSFVLYFK